MKKFGGFVIGVIVTVVSMVVGLLIFIGKIVHRGSKTMPWTTKRYIKDQFTFVDISKVKSAVANSIKAFIDWVFFAKETPYFKHRGDSVYKSCRYQQEMFDRSYHAQKHNDICETINKCMAKSDKSEPKPYFIDEDEYTWQPKYRCGHYMEFMYDISTDKLYDDDDEEEVTSCDFIKNMIKSEDPCIMEPGNYVYIHDPRDGTNYAIEIENLSWDEEDVDDKVDKSKDKED